MLIHSCLSNFMRLFAPVVIFLATFTWAQVKVQGSSSVYEGQKVDAVDLVGNPHRDPELLRPLVVQKAGEPYSQTKVEASIQALQKAGGFSKITVNVVPDLSGVRVNFLLEPVYYLGIVDFPGATKGFSYTRLLQVANLPDEDPYDPARVALGEQALQAFFKRNGYFQAAIQADTQIDDGHQLVNVTFIVKLGKQARIAAVQIDGTDSGEASRLLHSSRSLRAWLTGGSLKPGKHYTEERMKAAITLIKRTLSNKIAWPAACRRIRPNFMPNRTAWMSLLRWSSAPSSWFAPPALSFRLFLFSQGES